MLYIYHNAHMYIRRFSIYTINAYPYIYIWDHSSHISMHICLRQWSCSHSNISIIYSYICGSAFIKSLYCYYVLHNDNAPKAPNQKMPSAFQVSGKSSKLPLSFMKLQAHSIFWSFTKSLDQIKVEGSCLEVLQSILPTK